MKVKVLEATNRQLDYLVAKCLGVISLTSDGIVMGLRLDGKQYVLAHGWGGMSFEPSTNWSQGGPLIEKHKIDVYAYHLDNNGDTNPGWCAHTFGRSSEGTGPTLLIAAMRCLVGLVLSEEVEVPDVLL